LLASRLQVALRAHTHSRYQSTDPAQLRERLLERLLEQLLERLLEQLLERLR
jgi:hypothetical protein